MSTSISKVDDTNPNESLKVSLIIESAEGTQKRLTKLSKKAKLSEIKTTLKLEPNYKFLNVDDEELDDKLFQFNEFLNTQEFPVLNISSDKKTIKLSALERPRSTKEPAKVEFSELSSPYRNLSFIEASQPDMAPEVTITSIPEKISCYKTQVEELAQKPPLKNGKSNLGYTSIFNYANMPTFFEKSSLLNENHVSYQVTQPSKVPEATIISKAEKNYWDMTQLSDELIQSLLKKSKYNFGYTPMFGYANKPIFLEDWSRFNKTHISNNYPATKSLLWEQFSEILKAKMFVDDEARAKVKQMFWIATNQICNKEKVGKASQRIHFYAEKLIPKGSYNVRELCHKTVPEFQNFFPKDQSNKWIITKERFREFIQEYGLFFPTELVFGGKVYIQETVSKHEDFDEKKRSIEAYAKAALELVSVYSQNDASTSHSQKLTLHSLGGKPIVQGNPEDWLASLINNPQSCAVIKLRGLKYTFEFLEEELNQAIQSFLKNEGEILVEESMTNDINPGKALKNPFEYGPNYNMMLSFLSLIKKQIQTPVESSKIELIESILRKELENQRQYIYTLKMRELIPETMKIGETNKKPLVNKSNTKDSDSLLNKKLAIPLKNVSNHKMRSLNYETMTTKDPNQKASVRKSHTRDIDSYSEKALENPFEYVVNYKVKALAYGAKRISYLLLFRSDYLEIIEVEQKDRWISMIEDYAQRTKDSVVYFDCDGCKCSSEHEAVERSIPKFVM